MGLGRGGYRSRSWRVGRVGFGSQWWLGVMGYGFCLVVVCVCVCIFSLGGGVVFVASV